MKYPLKCATFVALFGEYLKKNSGVRTMLGHVKYICPRFMYHCAPPEYTLVERSCS